MTPEISHGWNGRAFVETNNTLHIGQALEITFWPKFSLIQIGNGERYLPVEKLELGKSARFQTGDYEITIKRTKVNKDGDPKIISLSEARRRRKGKKQ